MGTVNLMQCPGVALGSVAVSDHQIDRTHSDAAQVVQFADTSDIFDAYTFEYCGARQR